MFLKKSKSITAHPGEILCMLMQEHKITQHLLAAALDEPQTKISHICRGKLGISAELGLKLEKALGMKATLWMSLQKNWELSQVAGEKLRKVKKLKLILEQQKAIIAP